MIVGNRGFFPHHLAAKGRETILGSLEQLGIHAVVPDAGSTDHGAIESLVEARLCAEVFKQHRDEIDGILVTLPNFGDERSVANVIKFAGLNVPVLVHAFPDDPAAMTIDQRRDSFCGKMSVCNNLRQYGIRYSLTTQHTSSPVGASFKSDLSNFAATCRVVRGLRRARIGLIGARPANFTTVRFSEKLLERAGISVETLDLSDVFGRVDRIDPADDAVAAKRDAIQLYSNCGDVPEVALMKMAKLSVVIDQWRTANQLDAVSIQCWSSMQENFGVVPCAIMSMASDSLLPAACEADVTGALSMLALVLASGRPAALVDWNNNYGDDPDKAVVFHCSNLPKTIMDNEKPRMGGNPILGNTFGRENVYGTLVGRVKANPFTYLRVSTDDTDGRICAYVGEGEFTHDALDTFGGYGVVHVPRLQDLLAYICENGFEHHVALAQARVVPVLSEALVKYLEWPVYDHTKPTVTTG
ncbi:MAG: L-fucose/L-arabinose isomerase family protein [Acidimicrobiales bacterium]